MDSKLNTTLGKKLSVRQPKRLPKQVDLPSKRQLKEILQDVESNHFGHIELPFGAPPEYYNLVAMKDRLKGNCQWNLYRGEGEQSALEWTVNGNDWEDIHGRICALFPGWDLQNRTLATDNTIVPNEIVNAQTVEEAQHSTFVRSIEGDLRKLQVPTLLQTVSMSKLTGRLQIQSRSGPAQVFFNDGIAVHCRLENAEGDAAIMQLVGWEEGKFCFFPEPKTDLKTINKPLDRLLIEGAQFSDQFKSLNSKGLSFDALVARVHASITEEEFDKLLAAGTGIDRAGQKKFYVSIDNRSTLFEILRSQQLSQVQWVPILFNLVNCGLIEFRHPAEASSKFESTYKGSKVEWGQIQMVEKLLTMPETGLYSFPAFLFFLDREYVRFERFKRPFSIVVLKIGILQKTENSNSESIKLTPLPLTAVKDLGKTVHRIKRQIDILAHYQTFDYALLLPETDKQSAGNFVDRLSEVLRVTSLRDIGVDQIIDFAIGHAALPDDGNNLDLIISLAQSRLYKK